MIKKFGEYLFNKELVNTEQKEIIIYGLQVLWLLIINWCTAIILGLRFHALKETILFLCLILPLRRYSGGFHAGNPYVCYVYSQLIILICTRLIVHFYLFIPLRLFLLPLDLLAAHIIFHRSPISSIYHPLCYSKYYTFRHYSQGLTIT